VCTSSALPRLSKSKFVAALQCEGRLWLAVNCPELEAFVPQLRASFATGHRAGEVAREAASAEYGAGEIIDVNKPAGLGRRPAAQSG
jgi:hypothetical protein